MSMTIDDAEVIRSFKAGDRAAFESVVAEYQAELRRHARRRSRDAGNVDDLVQETFLRAYRAFDRLPDDSQVRPWLHQILRNVCIDDAHRRRREHDKNERARTEPPSATRSDGPEEVLGLDHDASALAEALADLPATHRDAFVQRVVVGLDYDEIAAREGLSEPNVRARVSRARSALQRALQGAAAVPVACYLLIRRPGRGALAAPPDPSGASAATTVAASPSTVDTAGRIATSLAPAVEAATNVATGASHTVPLLAKAAVGIGAVATVSLATGPEPPIEIPPAVTVEVAADGLNGSPDDPVVVIAPAPAELPAPAQQQAEAVSQVTTVPSSTAAVAQLEQAATALVPAAVPEPVADPAPAPPTVSVAPATPPGTTTPPPTTPPPTTLPPTTLPLPTVPPTTVPPLIGGSLRATVSVTPAGPRLDLAGSGSLAIGSTSSGSLSGRIGVGDPDPAGSRRIDGVVTLSLGTGTIEIRLAGHAASAETTAPGVPPTSLTMSGVYRASGATGQLLTSGSFSGLLSGGSLSLTLSA